MSYLEHSSDIRSSIVKKLIPQNKYSSVANAFIICSLIFPSTKALADQEPFVLTGSCNFAQNNGVCAGAPQKSPERRDVVIEFVTALCDVSAIGQPAVYLKLVAESQVGKKIEYHLAPSHVAERPQSTRTTTAFTHETKIYVGKSSKIAFEFQIPNSGVVGECNLTLQGK
jgi:hypothetical protein